MKRLILAGAGHAHLHVLKALAVRREPDVEVVLVSPHARQIHSGMLPGWIAGHYALAECAAKLEPLAKAAGASFLRDTVLDVDANGGSLICAHAGRLDFEVLSIDTGATVDISWLAATGARLLPIRPLERFAVGWNRLLETFRGVRQAHVAVVGGGAAGVELALAIRHRLGIELDAGGTQVVLVAGSALLPGHGSRVVARVRDVLKQAGIEVVHRRAVGSERGLTLADGSELAADGIVAATGAMPPAWMDRSGLSLAADGFIAVNAGQQSLSHAAVFVAGDIASRQDIASAGSDGHAAHAGPVLATNLRRALAGLSPMPYQPRQRALHLLAAGPREAIMSWHGLVAGGRWAWRWKDWLDRRFLRQYDFVLGGHS